MTDIKKQIEAVIEREARANNPYMQLQSRLDYKTGANLLLEDLVSAWEALEKLRAGNWPKGVSSCAGDDIANVMLKGNVEIAIEITDKLKAKYGEGAE